MLLVAYTLCFLFVLTSQNSTIAEICGENELLTDCGTRCESTCIELYPECEGDCAVNVCRCKQGYIRLELDGPCIPDSSCPPQQPPPTCTGVVCKENQHCEIVDLPCANGLCLQDATCVDDPVV